MAHSKSFVFAKSLFIGGGSGGDGDVSGNKLLLFKYNGGNVNLFVEKYKFESKINTVYSRLLTNFNCDGGFFFNKNFKTSNSPVFC